jgi:Lon protease-like protein
MHSDGQSDRELALFPLQAVLFPDGLLRLKIFEARYLDLMSACLRDSRPFGVVALRSGSEVERKVGREARAAVSFEGCGTTAELISADSDQPGIMQVRCRGAHRFTVHSSAQRPDGLWVAQTSPLDDDEALAPAAELIKTVRGLATMIGTLNHQGESPFLEPYRFEDAGWVANRWCEILPISTAAKQKLMELPDPMVRLQLVDEFLRSKRVLN